MIRFKLGSSYMEDKDNFAIYFVPCPILLFFSFLPAAAQKGYPTAFLGETGSFQICSALPSAVRRLLLLWVRILGIFRIFLPCRRLFPKLQLRPCLLDSGMWQP
ncbi:hypothetical protein SLEP1_g26378 [Rubroshorea leprosula]|uniref:Uncharacterized protein n=1 Tax=Rubroshorea leprosula TaxID=152421 RepID=A0AAV5JT39_9ROSI|nr:hypothetical protein SLEP1_g26378 [Rubroshorea leprosula]